MSQAKVRTRFAPSPTGYLHVGGARTALYSWLYARKMGGAFVLRIEDTDMARNTDESLKMVIQDLKWLGLNWDEGPEVGGKNQPYKQSERLDIYKEHAERLLKNGKAFRCFCTEEQLAKSKESLVAQGKPPHYEGTCRNLKAEDVAKRLAAGEKAVVRFRVPQNQDSYTVKDLVRGDVTFPSDMVGDFVILRSDGMPVYNFCCVVDDALMNITHVLRAEEHLSNTVRQLMLYQAFDYPLPEFGHLSIILGADKQKLSKRHGATSCHQFKEMGYLPEALVNFMALCGWSSPSGDEILPLEKLIEQFDLDRLQSAAAVFDETKFKWMNSHYLRALPTKRLWQEIQAFLDKAGVKQQKAWQDPDWQEKALSLFKTSMETLLDAVPHFTLLSDEKFQITDEAKEVYTWDSTRSVLEKWKQGLEAMTVNFLSEADFNTLQDKVKNESGAKGKNLFMPIRVAVIGKPHGAELKQLVPLMERQSLISRAETALSKFT